jgi:hypothetical protein
VGTLVGGHRCGRIRVALIQAGVRVFGTLEVGQHSVDGESARQPGQHHRPQAWPISGRHRLSELGEFGGPVRGVLALHRGKFGQDLPSCARRGVGKAAVQVGAAPLRGQQTTKPAGCLRISTHRILTYRPG